MKRNLETNNNGDVADPVKAKDASIRQDVPV